MAPGILASGGPWFGERRGGLFPVDCIPSFFGTK
jgi:hypothetical protein